jgi:DNA-binding response OmpR family regulator
MKVLIIDDNQSITSMLQKYLVIKGFEVEVANNGKNGLSLIQQRQFNAVLLDLSMPDFSGLDLIEQLERDNALSNQNIVLFTASSVSNDTINSLLTKDGIQTCLRKPVKLADLVQTLSLIK